MFEAMYLDATTELEEQYECKGVIKTAVNEATKRGFVRSDDVRVICNQGIRIWSGLVTVCKVRIAQQVLNLLLEQKVTPFHLKSAIIVISEEEERREYDRANN